MEVSPATTVVSTSMTESNTAYCAASPSPSDGHKGSSTTPQLQRCNYTPAAERSGASTTSHEGGDTDKG